MTYSLEKRKAAGGLYIKHGRNAADVVRELGYPNRHEARRRYHR